MQAILSTDAAYPFIIHMVMDFWEVPITFTFLIITNEMPVDSAIELGQWVFSALVLHKIYVMGKM